MPYVYMSKEEIEISKIKDIESIKVYNLKDDDAEAILGILCTCKIDDKIRYLNYTELDKEFIRYFSTLKSVYNLEKDKRKIEIDEDSKKLIEYISSKIPEKTGKSFPKLIDYKSTMLESYSGIITSTLKDVFKFLNKEVEFLDIKAVGMGGVITYSEDYKKALRFNFDKEKDSLNLRVANVLGNRELIIEIKDREVLEIKFYDSSKTFYGSKRIRKNILREEIYANFKLVYSEVSELEEIDGKKLGIEKGRVFLLPFSDRNDIRVIENASENEILKETITDINIRSKHIRKRIYQNAIFVSENYKGVMSSKVNIKLEDINEEINIYEVGDYKVEEITYFEAPLSNAYYKEYLEGKTFYRVFKDNEELEVPFNIKGCELLDENELKLKLRSDK